MIVRNLGNWERMTSLDRLVMLFLEQPRMLLVFAARAHCWLIFTLFTRNLRSFSAMLFFCWSLPACAGAVPLPGLQLTFAFFGLHEVSVGSFLQPNLVPLKGGTTSWCIGHCSQFSTIWKLAEWVLWPFVQVINGDVKPYWPQKHLLGCLFSSWFPNELHTSCSPPGLSVFNPLHESFQRGRTSGCFSLLFPSRIHAHYSPLYGFQD